MPELCVIADALMTLDMERWNLGKRTGGHECWLERFRFAFEALLGRLNHRIAHCLDS